MKSSMEVLLSLFLNQTRHVPTASQKPAVAACLVSIAFQENVYGFVRTCVFVFM